MNHISKTTKANLTVNNDSKKAIFVSYNSNEMSLL